MKTEFLNPFIVSIASILESTISESPKKGKVFLRNESTYKTEDVVIIVGITGQLTGQVVISMGFDTAKNIAAVMLMEDSVPELDEIAQSALAEMANMITANSMMGLSEAGYICDITPPSVITGSLIEITCREDIRTIVIPMELSLGAFEVNLSIIESRAITETADDFNVEVK